MFGHVILKEVCVCPYICMFAFGGCHEKIIYACPGPSISWYSSFVLKTQSWCASLLLFCFSLSFFCLLKPLLHDFRKVLVRVLFLTSPEPLLDALVSMMSSYSLQLLDIFLIFLGWRIWIRFPWCYESTPTATGQESCQEMIILASSKSPMSSELV